MSLNLRSSGTPLTQNELDNNLTFLYSRDITGSTVSGTTLFLYKQDGTVLSTQLPSNSGGTGIDTFTTGFTYSNNNLTISRNQGQPPLNVTINNFTGLTVNGSLSASTYLGLPSSTFTGNTSASCITDLYVSNIYGCSPITIHDSIQSVGSSATGITSFAFGNNTVAIGIASHAEGDSTQAIGIASHVEGSSTIANGNNSHAEGENTTTVGEGSHVEGYGTLTGQYFYTLDSVVAGVLTINSGYGDVSSQFSTAVLIEDAGSIFYYIIDSTIFSSPNTIITLVDTSVNSGTNVGVPGIPTPVGADILFGIGYSHAEGQNTSATGGGSHAEGNGTNAIGFDSHAEGNGTITVGVGSHTEGYVTQAIGDYSHAEGTGTQAIGGGSHAEGDTTLAIGTGSHTEGSSTQAIGIGSHAEGRTSVAIGAYSHSEGNGTFSGAYAYLVSGTSGNNIVLNPSYGDVTSQFTSSEVFVYNSLGIGGEVLNFSATSYNNITSATTVVVNSIGLTTPYYILPNPNETTIYNPLNADQNIGIYSHAEGFGTQAIGAASHAEGNRTTAIGISSHAEGGNTQAIGVYSHAEGNYTQAFGNYSHSQGVSTIASGDYSFASGSGSTATGEGSHAEGETTSAIGDYSHAEGSKTQANGVASHAGGSGSNALNYGEFAASSSNSATLYGQNGMFSLYATSTIVGGNPMYFGDGTIDILLIDDSAYRFDIKGVAISQTGALASFDDSVTLKKESGVVTFCPSGLSQTINSVCGTMSGSSITLLSSISGTTFRARYNSTVTGNTTLNASFHYTQVYKP